MTSDINEVLLKIDELKHMVKELETRENLKSDQESWTVPSPLKPGTY